MSSQILSELSQFTRAQKWFVFFAMATGFLIASEYAITRPASSAMFLSLFSSKAIPWVWLISVPFNLLIIYLYNRFLPRLGPLKIIGAIGLATVCVNLTAAFSPLFFPSFIFLQFIWKDIYILLMFKQLWSMIHSTIPSGRAKYLYGLIFGMGTLGSIIGSTVPSFFAVGLGSQHLFLFTLPLYTMLYLSYRAAFQRSALNTGSFLNDLTLDPHPKEGFSMIRRSGFLMAVLTLVIFMQVSVGLMDYQFNIHLENNIFEQDLRTEYCGRLVGLTNILSGAFQFLGGFLMIHFLGIRGSHLFIPFVLLSNAIFCWILPSFAIISFSYAFLKSIDFSLFGVIREMLYIPLRLDEKFRAKAIIDVFAYRSSKAFVSLCMLMLQFSAGAYLLQIASLLSIAVFLAWIIVISFFFKKYTAIIKESFNKG
jgi:AAA family ATP:ADP antiporter